MYQHTQTACAVETTTAVIRWSHVCHVMQQTRPLVTVVDHTPAKCGPWRSQGDCQDAPPPKKSSPGKGQNDQGHYAVSIVHNS